MAKKLGAFIHALNIILLIVSLKLVNYYVDVSKATALKSSLWKADSNLTMIIDDFIKIDTSAQDHPLVVLNVVKSQRCTQDYLLSSTNFIPSDLMLLSPPSKFFEYKNRLCIIVDPNDQFYSSQTLKDKLSDLIRKHKVSISTIMDDKNKFSIQKWHIKLHEGKIIVNKQEPFEDFSCDQNFDKN